MECPKCSSEMTEGFLIDEAFGAVKQTRWVPGPVAVNELASVKDHVRIEGEPVGVTTFRCGSCGYLESYAR